MASSLRLPLVSPGDELSGSNPVVFERLARSVQLESGDHRGLAHIVLTLVEQTVRTSVPPSTTETLSQALRVAREWIQGRASASEVKNQRAVCFSALPWVEQATVSAVEKALELGGRKPTPLDRHADHVVLRYASLAAHFTVSAVCHTLDVLETPAIALEVPKDVVGARAYQTAGLGAARHSEFRERALEQAEWEAGRETSRARGHTVDALAPQIFHEYLGARWRAHAAAERAQVEAFIEWALTGRSSQRSALH